MHLMRTPVVCLKQVWVNREDADLMVRLNEAGPAADPVCRNFLPTTGAAAHTAGNPDLLPPPQQSCSPDQSSSAASEPASELDGALRSRRWAVGTGCSAAGPHSSDWRARAVLGRVAAVVARYRRRGRIRHVLWPPAYTSGRRCDCKHGFVHATASLHYIDGV